MSPIQTLLAKDTFTHDDLVAILGVTADEDMALVQKAAEQVQREECGNTVYYRGLVEASNACRCDCFYCGIRKSNGDVRRYTLSEDEIMACAALCARSGYGSMVIQSGERGDKAYIDMLDTVIRRIKRETSGDTLPAGLGITLCIGQQTRETYRRLFDAGAHRYLLRIETTNPALFASIHPADQTFEERCACLRMLREEGYQIGTGVLIGLPGQTLDDLARDIQFYDDYDIDMIGMGPFIPHAGTPLGDAPCLEASMRVRMALLMIAATRLRLRDVNIASTTALQALDPIGREKGLRFGANIIMPQVTPQEVRKDYQLYPGKPCMEESTGACRSCLENRVTFADRVVGYNQWGDSPHARKRNQKP